MAEHDLHEGGCLCGAVRYRITGQLDSVVHCHCSMCRRASGAPVVTWVTVPPARFQLLSGDLRIYRSSAAAERGFCASCGAPVTFRTSSRPDEVDVTLGTLDCAGDHPADYHIWTSSGLAWLHLDEDLPAHARFMSDSA